MEFVSSFSVFGRKEITPCQSGHPFSKRNYFTILAGVMFCFPRTLLRHGHPLRSSGQYSVSSREQQQLW